MSGKLRALLSLPVLALALAQFVRPAIENPPVDPARSLWNDRTVDPRVAGILKRACADCHSHETVWPWYSKISPVSWFMAKHIQDGREKLNLSEWTPSQDQMEEIYDSIAKRKMPLQSYVLMHPDAKLSASDQELLNAWVRGKLATQNITGLRAVAPSGTN